MPHRWSCQQSGNQRSASPSDRRIQSWRLLPPCSKRARRQCPIRGAGSRSPPSPRPSSWSSWIAIVNVALPSIQSDLHFSQESLQWVLTAYSIMFGGFLMLGGRVADLGGRRRVFMAGVTLFTVSSLLCGLAWSEGSLIAFRAAQGLGGAILSPAALSILTTTFREGRERNLALGVWGAIAGTGAAAGTLLGGVLTSRIGWEWIFFVNVPVGAAVTL